MKAEEKRVLNGCSATGSRSTNNLVNEGRLLGPIGSRFLGWLGRPSFVRGIAPRVGLRVTRAPRFYSCVCTFPPPRARLVGNAFPPRAKSSPLTRVLFTSRHFYSSLSILFFIAISFNDIIPSLSEFNILLLSTVQATSLPFFFVFNSIFHHVQSILVS